MRRIVLSILLILMPILSFASSSESLLNLHMTSEPIAILTLVLFAIAYLFVMTEEFTHLRKSKPVILVAGFIWVVVGITAQQKGLQDLANATVKHNILEFIFRLNILKQF